MTLLLLHLLTLMLLLFLLLFTVSRFRAMPILFLPLVSTLRPFLPLPFKLRPRWLLFTLRTFR